MSAFVKENWSFLQEHLWTSTLMFVMFLVSLGVLAVDKRGSARRVFWYSVILLAGVVYNPFFWFVFVNGVYKGDDLVQLRLAWMIPAFLIMAYAMSRIVFLAKKWQVMVAVLFIVLIWWAGVPFHPDVIVKKQNIYKISEDAKESADIIHKDMEDHPEHLKDRPGIMEFNSTDYSDDITPANFYHYGIRQYTSKITVHPATVDEEKYNAEGFSVTGYYNEPFQYLIYEIQAIPVGESAERYGYSEISRTPEHVIMRYHRDVTVYLVIRGQTQADTSDELRGNSGTVSLTTTGWWRVLELGRYLSEVEFAAAYASETGQAQRTANVILRMNSNRDTFPGIGAVANLNDVSWGICEGWKIRDVMEQYGEEVLSNGDVSDELYVSPIGAESKNNAAKRIDRSMGDFVKNLQEDGKNILVVANPSAGWWLEEYVAGGEEAEKLKPGDCVKLRFTDGEWRIEELMMQ